LDVFITKHQAPIKFFGHRLCTREFECVCVCVCEREKEIERGSSFWAIEVIMSFAARMRLHYFIESERPTHNT